MWTDTTKKFDRSRQARLVAKPILTSVQFTNKRLDFCKNWLGEHKGPVRLSFMIIDACFCRLYFDRICDSIGPTFIANSIFYGLTFLSCMPFCGVVSLLNVDFDNTGKSHSRKKKDILTVIPETN